MSCCAENITNFNNVSITNTPFIGTIQPLVTVLYLVAGEWISAGISTQIAITPGNVKIDHGGPATGIVKLS